MFETQNMGKTIGALLLIQVIIGVFIQFGVLGELFADPGFQVNGAELSLKVGFSVIPAILLGCFNILIGSILYNAFKQTSPVLTLFFLVFAGANLAISAFEFSAVMNMISFSKQYLAASAEQAGLILEMLRPLILSTRNWIHFMGVGFSGAIVFMFYLLMYRGSTTPKFLSAIGMLAALIQLSTVTQPFFGNNPNTLMLVPIGLVQIVMPIYFMVKGIAVKQ